MKKINDVWTSHGILSTVFGNHKPKLQGKFKQYRKSSSYNVNNA